VNPLIDHDTMLATVTLPYMTLPFTPDIFANFHSSLLVRGQ
jgi:hypothetical protein